MSDGLGTLCLLGAIAWYWNESRRAHEIVLGVSTKTCRELNVQRLDDTVALRSLRLAWTHQGPALRRIYGFEFSRDGATRSRGEIALVRRRIAWIRIEDSRDGPYYLNS